jgi:hypothetical protein
LKGRLLLAAGVLWACGEKHPAFVDETEKPRTGGASGSGDNQDPDTVDHSGGKAGKTSRGGAGGTSAGGAAGKSNSGAAGKNNGGTLAMGDAGTDATGAAGAPNPVKIFAFQESEIYIWGTLTPGSAYHEAIAHYADPNRYLVGFYQADNRSGVVSGDRLVYWGDDSRPHRFEPEGAWTAPPQYIKYPANPESDDPLVETPECEKVSRVLFNAAGRMIYNCYLAAETAYVWFDGTQRLYVAKDDTNGLLALGANDIALGSWAGFYTLDLNVPETKHPVTAIKNGQLAIRGHADGFRLVENVANVGTLWQVSPDGSAEKLGVYPDMPAGFHATYFDAGTKQNALGPDDALYSVTYHNLGGGPTGDAIIRRKIDGTSEIVYDEVDKPLVYSLALFTGP